MVSFLHTSVRELVFDMGMGFTYFREFCTKIWARKNGWQNFSDRWRSDNRKVPTFYLKVFFVLYSKIKTESFGIRNLRVDVMLHLNNLYTLNTNNICLVKNIITILKLCKWFLKKNRKPIFKKIFRIYMHSNRYRIIQDIKTFLSIALMT